MAPAPALARDHTASPLIEPATQNPGEKRTLALTFHAVLALARFCHYAHV